MKLHCGFSNTPGEIVWKYGGNTITNDAVYKISQRLLKTEPVLYEGVLEINDKLNGLIPYCTIYSTIIASRVDLISKSKVITGEEHHNYINVYITFELFKTVDLVCLFYI